MPKLQIPQTQLTTPSSSTPTIDPKLGYNPIDLREPMQAATALYEQRIATKVGASILDYKKDLIASTAKLNEHYQSLPLTQKEVYMGGDENTEGSYLYQRKQLELDTRAKYTDNLPSAAAASFSKATESYQVLWYGDSYKSAATQRASLAGQIYQDNVQRDAVAASFSQSEDATSLLIQPYTSDSRLGEQQRNAAANEIAYSDLFSRITQAALSNNFTAMKTTAEDIRGYLDAEDSDYNTWLTEDARQKLYHALNKLEFSASSNEQQNDYIDASQYIKATAAGQVLAEGENERAKLQAQTLIKDPDFKKQDDGRQLLSSYYMQQTLNDLATGKRSWDQLKNQALALDTASRTGLLSMNDRARLEGYEQFVSAYTNQWGRDPVTAIGMVGASATSQFPVDVNALGTPEAVSVILNRIAEFTELNNNGQLPNSQASALTKVELEAAIAGWNAPSSFDSAETRQLWLNAFGTTLAELPADIRQGTFALLQKQEGGDRLAYMAVLAVNDPDLTTEALAGGLQSKALFEQEPALGERLVKNYADNSAQLARFYGATKKEQDAQSQLIRDVATAYILGGMSNSDAVDAAFTRVYGEEATVNGGDVFIPSVSGKPIKEALSQIAGRNTPQFTPNYQSDQLAALNVNLARVPSINDVIGVENWAVNPDGSGRISNRLVRKLQWLANENGDYVLSDTSGISPRVVYYTLADGAVKPAVFSESDLRIAHDITTNRAVSGGFNTRPTASVEDAHRSYQLRTAEADKMTRWNANRVLTAPDNGQTQTNTMPSLYGTAAPEAPLSMPVSVQDAIGEVESKADGYNAIEEGKMRPHMANPNFVPSETTLGEWLAVGRESLNNQYDRGGIPKGSGTSAMGRYQFVRSTLLDLQKRYNLPSTLAMTPDNQDRLAYLSLLARKDTFNYISQAPKNSKAKARDNLRGHWEGLKHLSNTELNKMLEALRDSYEAGDLTQLLKELRSQ